MKCAKCNKEIEGSNDLTVEDKSWLRCAACFTKEVLKE